MRAHVRPGCFDIDVGDDETLFEAAGRLGYEWPTICQGNARCLQCFVEVESGWENTVPAEAHERELLAELAMFVAGHVRLACRLQLTGDVAVRRPGVARRG